MSGESKSKSKNKGISDQEAKLNCLGLAVDLYKAKPEQYVVALAKAMYEWVSEKPAK